MAEATSSPIHVEEEASRGAQVDCADLCYSILVNGKLKRILKGVSFSLGGGDMCALMGPSGAGKSTLLDLIANRKTSGTWSGQVRIDNMPRGPMFSRDVAYVLQDDVHIATLSVEETLLYAAWVRMEEGTPVQVRQQRVDELLQMTGLSHVRNSMVGSAMTKGISGGQLKRLSIAVEIVALPRLLFLDEPTSGLDSSIAFEVMHTVRNVITKDRTCLVTIHQPSKEVFELFDKLVLLSAGRMIYFGAVADAASHFAQPEVGYVFEGGFKNPAEFVIEVSCGQRLPVGARMAKQPEELEMHYLSSRFYRPVVLSVHVDISRDQDMELIAGGDTNLQATSKLTQLKMLMHRSWTAKIRDRPDMIAQLAKNIGLGLGFGIVFTDAGNISTPFYEDGYMTSDARTVNSIFFFFLVMIMVANVQAVPYLFSQRVLYHRELASSAYSPVAYWFSSLVTLTPLQLLFHFFGVTILYWMCGFNSNAGSFLYFFSTTFAATLLSYLTACVIAAWAPSEMVALAIFPAQFLVWTTFMGFAIKLDDLPSYWAWVAVIDYPRWLFEGLMVNFWNQYDTDDFTGDLQDGSGDVLASYNFDNFNAADVNWIALLFAGTFAGILYVGLLPPRSNLLKVEDAKDLMTFISSQKSIAQLNGSSYFKGSAKSLGGGDLQSSLIDEGGVLEEHLVVQDPLLEHEPKLGVDHFRTSAGIVQAAKGCKLFFKNVDYSVTSKHDGETTIELLRGVSGCVLPGEMCALMGASGAGKSTLLDVLAMRKSTGIVEGLITYNGSATMTSSAYVMQDNAHMGILTVRESIHYAAELRLSEHMSKEAKAKRVAKIIDILGLQKVADSILGTSEVRGISGGQLKRVSIGVEIVSLPDLMFLDEPTTGLDSSISLEVMSAVRNLANQNRTVVCTIHQPSEDTYALFDSLLLLAEGRVIYFGQAKGVVNYFASSPFAFPHKDGSNPAEYLVAVGGGFIPAADGRTITGGELAAYYSTTPDAAAASESHQEIKDGLVLPAAVMSDTLQGAEDSQQDTPLLAGEYYTSFWYSLKVLLRRRLLVMRKDPAPVLGPMGRDFAVGIFYGSVYFQLDTGEGCDETCYNDRLSLIFFSLMLMFMGQLDMVSFLVDDRLVYYRERGAKTYGPLAYWLSLWVPQVPILPFNVILYCMTVYPMCGLREGRFGVFFIFMLTAAYVCLFTAYIVASVAPSTEVALAYYPLIGLFTMLYAGYAIYIPDLQSWQRTWLPFLNFYRWAFQGMVLNEFQHNSDLPESHQYISDLGFDTVSIGGSYALLLLFLSVFCGTLYLVLKYVDFEER
ncbi:P-loop containing nucleoside triphosphate hydrolase protein [Ochromonadaceae sp. CCMP2298]|nr:P-loop containing nucleoside triphosphate hydrolase protein [Ochromonadaceae sp. CCMP2298]|mmetsp:Transcript_24117/g.52221  ORF Transcript_24117/g.52221 Transcript_24117/m.52221 type:complete len:1304 (+) Transcript_24117:86-3997(+)